MFSALQVTGKTRYLIQGEEDLLKVLDVIVSQMGVWENFEVFRYYDGIPVMSGCHPDHPTLGMRYRPSQFSALEGAALERLFGAVPRDEEPLEWE